MVEKQTVTIEEISNNNDEKTIENKIEIELSDGKKAVMDFSDMSTRILMKARMLQGENSQMSLSVYMISLITKFNGENLTPEEICDLDMNDFLLLEGTFTVRKKLI